MWHGWDKVILSVCMEWLMLRISCLNTETMHVRLLLPLMVGQEHSVMQLCGPATKPVVNGNTFVFTFQLISVQDYQVSRILLPIWMEFLVGKILLSTQEIFNGKLLLRCN